MGQGAIWEELAKLLAVDRLDRHAAMSSLDREGSSIQVRCVGDGADREGGAGDVGAPDAPQQRGHALEDGFGEERDALRQQCADYARLQVEAAAMRTKNVSTACLPPSSE